MEDREILRSLVDRAIRLKEQIKALQNDVADLYSEADSHGFDKKAIKEVVKRAMMDKDQFSAYEQLDLITENYWTNYNGSSLVQAHAHAREYKYISPETQQAVDQTQDQAGNDSTGSKLENAMSKMRMAMA